MGEVADLIAVLFNNNQPNQQQVPIL